MKIHLIDSLNKNVLSGFSDLMLHATLIKNSITYTKDNNIIKMEFKRIIECKEKKFLWFSYEYFDHEKDSKECVLTIRNVKNIDISEDEKIKTEAICTFTKIDNDEILIGSLCDHDVDSYLIKIRVESINITLEDVGNL